MNEQFVRNRITELRLKKDVSEYQMSLDLGKIRVTFRYFLWPIHAFHETILRNLRLPEITPLEFLIPKWQNRHSSAGLWSC